MIRNAPLNALLLLLDPRGRIAPGAFALGLGLLAVLVFLTMMIAGLATQHWNDASEDLAIATIPLLSVVVLSEPAWTLPYAGTLVIVGFRLWCLGCLCLKRLRHAHSARWLLIGPGLVTASIDLGAAFWIGSLRETLQGDDGLGLSVLWLIVCSLKALIWTIALIWIGLIPGAKRESAASTPVSPP
jgi:Mn2+/Fe2+ NRAMP family transporter